MRSRCVVPFLSHYATTRARFFSPRVIGAGDFPIPGLQSFFEDIPNANKTELIKTEATEELNYNCEYCHNKFPSPKSLKVHIFKIHKKATEIAKFVPKITKSSIVIDDKYCFESIESTIGNSSSFKYIPPVQSTGLVNTNCTNLIKKIEQRDGKVYKIDVTAAT